MNLSAILDIFAALVTVAMVYVLVSNKGTAQIITAWGQAFSTSVKAATGR